MDTASFSSQNRLGEFRDELKRKFVTSFICMTEPVGDHKARNVNMELIVMPTPKTAACLATPLHVTV